MSNRSINICLTADENYSMQAGVCITSILYNNPNTEFRFFLLTDSYSKETKDRFCVLEHEFHTSIILIDVTEKLKQLNKSALYVREAVNNSGIITFTYARLFIGSLLPEKIVKVIYIDCDTFCRNGIERLFDYEIKGIMGAVIDLYPVEYNAAIGFADNDLYFNAGVLLINLDKWRKENVEQNILEYIYNLKHTLFMRDQDILNLLLKNKIDIIPLEYNMMYISRAYSPESVLKFTGKLGDMYYSIEDQKKAKSNEVIVHFAGDYFGKPWNYPNSNKYAREWNEIKAFSPWGGYSLKNNQ